MTITKSFKLLKNLMSSVWYPASIQRFEGRLLMRLYSPVDLTGNVNMIYQLVLGGTGTGYLPILSPTR